MTGHRERVRIQQVKEISMNRRDVRPPRPMAENDEAKSSALRQRGRSRARDNKHLFALMRAFSTQPLPEGNGVMVITYTGSPGIAAVAALSPNNMQLGTLEPHLQKRLGDILPNYINTGNPVDCPSTMSPEQMKELFEIGVESMHVHGFILILQGEGLAPCIDALKDIDYKGKPIVSCMTRKEFMLDEVVKMGQAGIPVYSTPEMAAEVLGEMYHYSLRRRNARADSIARRLPKEPLSIDNMSVRLRLISHEDISLWTDFVNSCSGRSLWLRFLSPFSPTPERARRFCDVNIEDEIAVVAEMTEADRKKLIGIARIIKNKRHCEEAEYAVLVSDPWQRKRLGYALSGRCIDLARHEGFKIVRSEMLQKNFPMIRIFRRYNFQFDGKDENMISMSLNLS